MFKINGIPRKQVSIVDITNLEMDSIKVSINKHPNGKLNLPEMKKTDVIKLLEFKGYL